MPANRSSVGRANHALVDVMVLCCVVSATALLAIIGYVMVGTAVVVAFAIAVLALLGLHKWLQLVFRNSTLE
jgi:hypothetical protein